MDYEKNGPAKTMKCAECGSSIPAGNLSCYTCGTTVNMEGTEGSQVEHPFPTFLEQPGNSVRTALSFPGPQESGDAREPEMGTYYPPRPNIPSAVEQYEEKKRELTPRQILGFCLLLVVLSSVAMLGWKRKREVRDLASYVQQTMFSSREEPKKPASSVAPAVAVPQPIRHFVQRSAVTMQEESPAPSATFMQVKVDGQPSTPDRAPSSLADFARYRQIDVSIGRPELAVTEKSRLHIEVSPRESLNFLLKQMAPVYPPAAREAHVQGAVVVKAIVGKDGLVKSVHAISGDPLLASAALDSVRHWVYRPYFRDGEPQEIETLIMVEFSLADNTPAAKR